jgi:polygalacturonase
LFLYLKHLNLNFSKGNNGSDESVSNVLFVNNTFEQTTAAVRIKTFEGGRGSIFNITYDGVYCR